MRSIKEIVEAVENNETVTDEEMRLALCSLNRLITFDRMAFIALYQAEKGGKLSTTTKSSPEWQCREHLRRVGKAFEKTPDQWLGWENNPENPDYRECRQKSIALVKKVEATLKKGKKNDHPVKAS